MPLNGPYLKDGKQKYLVLLRTLRSCRAAIYVAFNDI